MNIEITAKKDGTEIPLSDISTATFEKLKAEKECKKEKPKELREGDYEIDKNKIPIVWLRDGRGELWPNTPKGKEYPGNGIFDNDFELILGNIFDDLERNSKDLEEFVIRHPRANHQIKAEILDGEIFMGTLGNCRRYPIKLAQEYHQKLGQVIATAKRREAKTDY